MLDISLDLKKIDVECILVKKYKKLKKNNCETEN